MDLTLQEALSPVPGHEIWDYFAYVIFFLGIVALAIGSSDSSQFEMLALSAAIFIAVLDKTYAWGYITEPEGVINPTREQRIDAHVQHFATYAMRVLLFILPLVAAAQSKSNKIRGMGIILALTGLVYTFGRWWDEQRGSGGFLGLIVHEPQIFVQGSLYIVGVGKLFSRVYWQRLFNMNGRNPMTISGMVSTHNIEVEATQIADNIAHLTIADGTTVDFNN